MSRRGRSLVFFAGAALAALAAAALADGYGDRLASGYGELRPVLVAGADLAAGEPLDGAGLEVRRVPVRFAPPGALAAPVEAVGLQPATTIPAGSYVLAAQLRPPPEPGSVLPGLGGGRRPVQIAVSGAEALLAGGGQPVGSRIDVIVTTEPGAGGGGRTYVAAAGVPLLALTPAGEAGTASATLGLTRPQALRLIDAEAFARRVTVVPVP